MKKFLPLVFLVLSACAPSLGVYIDSSEPQALLEATETAVDTWNAELGADLLDLRVIDNPRAGYLTPCSIVITSRDAIIGGRNASTLHIGFINSISVRKGAIDEYLPSFLPWLITHEIGHVLLGYKHSSDPNNLMYDDPYESEEPYQLTKRQIRRARAVAGLESIL